jgi:hypothetical protein
VCASFETGESTFLGNILSHSCHMLRTANTLIRTLKGHQHLMFLCLKKKQTISLGNIFVRVCVLLSEFDSFSDNDCVKP